jgi:hypothetical protein
MTTEERELHNRITNLPRPRHWWAGLLVAVAMVLTSAVAAATATADTPGSVTSHGASVRVITAPMTVDCVHLSASARHYAVAHHYCPSGVGPDNVTPPGSCGTSRIFVGDNGDSTAFFEWGFDSTEGAVIGHSLTISWQIGAGGASFSDNNAPELTSSYRNSSNRFTGNGRITTALDGRVVLWWGGICGISHPTDSNTIT